MKWKKVKPWTRPIHQGCLNCPPVLNLAPMNTLVAVGFGCAQITRDKETIYDGEKPGRKVFSSLRRFEKMACKDPRHDWRLILEAPLRGREYQRQGKGKWVLIKSGPGFA